MCTCHAYTLCVRRIASVSRAINVTVFYAFVVFRVFVVKEKLHRVPLQDVGYVRATQRCGSVTSKSLGVGEFTRYRPLLVLPFATRPLRIASSFSLSLSFRYLYFLPLTFFHLIYMYIYIYIYLLFLSSLSSRPLSLSLSLSHTYTYIHTLILYFSLNTILFYLFCSCLHVTHTHACTHECERARVRLHTQKHTFTSFFFFLTLSYIHATRTYNILNTNLRVAFLPRVERLKCVYIYMVYESKWIFYTRDDSFSSVFPRSRPVD